MKVDLHCHSHFSDGKHAPEFLIQRAIQNQVTHLAITDHDCTAALSQVSDQGSELKLINGVEISCDWKDMEIHIVGLLIDPETEDLRSLLASQQRQRRSRVRAIDEKLQSLGEHGLLPYLHALPCISYTRSHIADFLIAQGICHSRQKAFKTHLGRRGKIYVKSAWCSLEQAISTINKAGGIAVIAHPGRYSMTKRKLDTLIDDVISSGGEALEATYANIDHRTKKYLSDLCRTKKLYASVGSDFHDAAAHWTDIGRYPPLDQLTQKNAIWLHPKWHSAMK